MILLHASGTGVVPMSTCNNFRGSWKYAQVETSPQMTVVWAYFMINDDNQSKSDCKLCSGRKEVELQHLQYQQPDRNIILVIQSVRVDDLSAKSSISKCGH